MEKITKKCTCHNYYMDTHYGAGLRVVNVKKGQDVGTCTACGKTLELTPEEIAEVRKLEEPVKTEKKKRRRAPSKKKSTAKKTTKEDSND